MLDKFRHIHFIGIGGSGISSIAHLALAHGLKVTGSDSADSAVIKALKKHGARIVIGHKKENVNELTEIVVYTEAIDKNTNPEFLEAKRLDIPVLSYFEAIGEISKNKKTVAVIGTHGKTTTTAMLGQALISAGLNPTVIVGSLVKAFDNTNIHIGHSEWFVVEGCEYRRSFMSLQPFGAVLLSCEPDHLDYYKDENDYVSAFTEFVKKIPKNGFLVYNSEDKNCRKVSVHCAGKLIPVDKTHADKLDLRLLVPGEFNRSNAAHAYAAAREVGAGAQAVIEALNSFQGTARRLEMRGEKNGVTVFDDYAHHPTEIKASLKALRQKYPKKKIVCVYQPHQYSRTLVIMDELRDSFKDADIVIIPNIYAARDTAEDKKKISAQKLVEMISKKHPNAIWSRTFAGALSIVKKELKAGDILVIMGAGDIYKVADKFLR
jgi:UDP-N-acetylmuramate--alanine ligase